MSADPAATAPVGRPQPSAEARWVALLAVVVVIALVAGGGEVAARGGAAAAPQVVGGAVRIRPLPGWAAAAPPGATLAELDLTRGPVTLAVVGVPGSTGSPQALAQTYVDRVLRPRFDQLEIGQSSAGALAAGAPAIRFGYIGISDGVAIEGVATVATGPTAGAVFDAWAPKGDLAWAASQVDTMIDGAEVG